MVERTCLVTVGSTKFDDLVSEVLSERILKLLSTLRVSRVILQMGSSCLNEQAHVIADFSEEEGSHTVLGITIEYYRYKPSLVDDIKRADFVVGHAGAGTCMECLTNGKPLIVVVNDSLMDNHQMELAQKLADLGHLLYCTPRSLDSALSDDSLFSLKPFSPPAFDKFVKYIDRKLDCVVDS